MDPQQRKLMEVVWHALEDARIKPSALAGSKTGVYVGACNTDYAEILDRAVPPDDLYVTTGTFASMLANRISYFFDFCGPSICVDTSCSSSLVAAHMAVRALRARECAVALVAGVNLCLTPKRFRSFASGGMLSADGRCKTFDAAANGYVRGEGIATIVLKRLADARAAGDRIYGVIRGSAVNHGGRTRGLTVTSPTQQAQLILDACDDAGVSPQSLGYVEVHGTGTALGDPIEFLGLKLAFEKDVPAARDVAVPAVCALGSVKTNIGHLEAAAGIAGLIKVLLSLRSGKIPASRNLESLNPLIKLEGTPFRIPVEAAEWLPGQGASGTLPRRAGVSSFGFGGAYAHAVVEEWREVPATVSAAGDALPIFFVSAKERDALRRQAATLAGFLASACDPDVPMLAVAHALQTQREAMEWRLAFPVHTRDDAIARLLAVAEGADAPDALGPLYVGRATARRGATNAYGGDPALCDSVADWLRQQGKEALASRWSGAQDPDWLSLYEGGGVPRPVDLPLYAFARERHGVGSAPLERVAEMPLPVTANPPPAAADALALRWEVVATLPTADRDAARGRRYLVLGADASARADVGRAFPNARLLDCDASDPEALADTIAQAGAFAGIVWLGPDAAHPAPGEAPDASRSDGVRQFSNLAQALRRAGADRHALDLFVLTRAALRVGGDEGHDPAHRGIHALAAALARTLPRWRIVGFDAPSSGQLPWAEAFALGIGGNGRLWAWRAGEWYRPEWARCPISRDAVPRFRQGGTYLLCGDLDDGGAALCAYLVDRYRARILWLPEQPAADHAVARPGKGVPPRVERVDALPDAPLSNESLAALRERFGPIHGILQIVAGDAADVLAAVGSEAPVAAGRQWRDRRFPLGELGDADGLDFLLLLAPHPESATGMPVAEAVETASWVDHLSDRVPCPVRAAAWPYGGTPEDRVSDASAALIEQLLDGPLRQLVATAPARMPDGAAPDRERTRLSTLPEDLPAPDGAALAASVVAPVPAILQGAAFRQHKRTLEQDIAALLFVQLRRLGLFEGARQEESRLDAWIDRRMLPRANASWLRRSIEILAEGGFLSAALHLSDDDIRAQWHAHRAQWKGLGLFEPEVAVLDAVLPALPDILLGKTPLTDILFAGTSMALMEGYYKNNVKADYFNDVLGDVVETHVSRRLARDPAARLRILEIGAGTGGTTARILPRLQPFRHAVAEYCYTDLSRAFLAHGRERYGADAAFLRFALFDAERPPEPALLEAGRFDLVIANNVLHATRNIRRTMRNTKAAMKRNGLLLLNEINEFDLFLHVAFGLFEGWWLFEDPATRIPGTPALSRDGWTRILRAEGFHSLAFPAEKAAFLGQDIVVAASDGVLRAEATEFDGAAPPTDEVPAGAATPSPASRLSEEAVARHVRDVLVDAVSQSLGLDPAKIDLETAFSDYGMDSIVGVRTIKALNTRLKTDLSTICLFEYPTPRALISHIVASYRDALAVPGGGEERETADVADRAAAFAAAVRPQAVLDAAPVFHRDPIAIVGRSGRYPGASSLAELWQHLAQGRDLTEEARRWDLAGPFDESLPPHGRYCRRGGFLDDIATFDAMFFNISGAEAVCMDPQQRVFLEEAWRALEDAGHAGESIEGQRCGVYVGYIGGDYERLFPRIAPPQTMWGNAGSMLAARIAYFLNLRGPAITIDTACSSSLVAMHLACQSLWNGEVDVALAGGVFLQSTPSFLVSANRAAMLSPDGTCYAFDDRANGFVPGEGAGVVVLKRLEDALAAGDHIYGVVRASGINQDGASNGITAPSASAQEELQRETYERFGIDPSHISLVEAHGTGTKLGDPVEFRALTNSFRSFGAENGFCTIGSIKANIGHTAAAAGITGVLKILLALEYRQIPPSANYQNTNSEIRLEDSPFRISSRLAEWMPGKGGTRLAAVSSYGLSGTNAHMVIEEAPPVADRRASRHNAPIAHLLVLSARSGAELARQAEQLVAHCLAHPDLDCGDVCYTLLLGRRHFAHRLAILVRDLDDLVANLRRWRAGSRPAGVHAGVAVSRTAEEEAARRQVGNAYIARCRQGTDPAALEAVAALYVEGYRLQFEDLFAPGGYRRVHLPTYPFTRDRYWIGDADDTDRRSARAPFASARPLSRLAAETALPPDRAYQFSGEEAFLADHRIAGKRLLPGVCHLTMAWSALRHALAEHGDPHDIVLENIVWRRPVVVDAPTRVDVRLATDHDDAWTFRVVADAEDEASATGYASGRARMRAAAAARPLHDLAALRARASQKVEAWEMYDGFARMGVDYGPSFRTLEAIETGVAPDGSPFLLATIGDDGVLADLPEGWPMSPGMLDGALQATFAGLVADAAGPVGVNPRLLFSIDRVAFLAPIGQRAWVYARCSGSAASERWQVDICDGDGRVCVALHDIAFVEQGSRQAEERAMPSAETCYTLARKQWIPARSTAESVCTPAIARHAVFLADHAPDFLRQMRLALPQASIDGFEPDAAQPLAKRMERLGQAALEAVQATVRNGGSGPCALQIVVPDVAPADPAFALYHALSGLARTVRLEHPDVQVQVVAVPAGCTPSDLCGLLRDSLADRNACEIAWRDGARQVLRFVEAGRTSAPTVPWKDGGVYLITGGAGGLGQIFTREILARAPQAAVILAGRRDAPAVAGAIPRSGGVTYRALDLCDRRAVQACIDEILASRGRLDGILHAAGVLGDELLFRKSAASFAATLAPKTFGAVHLDAATRNLPLDFLVLFSSIAAISGNVGQGDYATANAFLDAFAEHRGALVARSERSGKTLSINWPWWSDGGMQVAPQLHANMEDRGLRPLASRAALDAFYEAMGGDGQVAVFAGDSGLASRILQQANGSAREEGARPSGGGAAGRAVPAAEETLTLVRRVLAANLKFPVERIGIAAAFDEFGVDSILALQVVDDLEKTFGPLPKTLLFECRSAAELSAYLDRKYPDRRHEDAGRGAGDSEPDRGASPTRSVAFSRAPAARVPGPAEIAIVGMAGRYPGAATLAEFWDHLMAGRDCVREVPPERWDHGRYFDPEKRRPGKAYSKWGGFLDDVDAFDASFFNISPREAETMDPQERLFLQCAHHALEDAGYSRARCGREVGVFVGVMHTDYPLFAVEAQARGEPLTYLNHPASIANRVSYHCDFTGPSLAVDTMCSSSLSAVHLACQSILAGDCTAAIAGGVNLSIHPNKYLALSQGLFASSRGRCESFGEGGDGYVPSEGVGAVVLKTLAQAEADGDRIYGVIRGSAINHGGKANGFSVPSPAAQHAVVARAMARAGVSPQSIGYVEAHGTGTALGDPIEIAGLREAFGAEGAETGTCAIGSVKSNIGHCEAAAGVAGLTKILLQLQHGLLVPSIHSEPSNPNIDFAATPFRVQRELAAWPQPEIERQGERVRAPRLAGLSSFGAGGANAHLIVEEYPVAQDRRAEHRAASDPWAIIPLSARSREALRALAAAYVTAIGSGALTDADLPDIAFTLQVGRDAFEHRLAVCVASLAELADKLTAWLAGNDAQERLFVGGPGAPSEVLQALQSDEDIHAALATWLAKRKLGKLAHFWAQGFPIDWTALHADGARPRPRIVSLPQYPFARDRFWVPVAAPRPASAPIHLLAPAWEDRPAPDGEAPGPQRRVILFDACFSAQVAQLQGRHAEARCIVLAPRDAEPDAGLETLAQQLLAAIQLLLGPGLTQPVLVQLVVSAEDEAALALSALLRSARQEAPLLAGQVLALDADIGPADFQHILGANARRADEVEVRYHRGVRQIRKFARLAAGDGPARAMWKQGGVYLITGGAGAIARVFATEILAAAADAAVVLVGRSVADAALTAWMAQARLGGAKIDYRCADVSDARVVRDLIDDVVARWGRLDGVLHAAGKLSDGWIIDKTSAQLHAVLQPKVSGAVHLDAATAHLPLDFFVLFSSLAGTIGNAGQSDYAVANAFLDSLATQRAEMVREGRRSGRSLSVVWPLWRTGGMQVDAATVARIRETLELEPIETEEALAAFYRAFAASAPVVAVIKGAPSRVERLLAPEEAFAAAEPPVPEAATARDPATLRRAVTAHLEAVLSQTLKLSADKVSGDTPLEHYGIDSVLALEMIAALEKTFGKLPKTLFFQHASLDAIADYLLAANAEACGGLVPERSTAAFATAAVERREGAEPRGTPSTSPATHSADIAIIGIAGRYPGARDLAAFWQNLVSGRDSVGEIPADRWDFRPYFDAEKGKPGALYCKWGGFLDGVDEFDALFFNIAPFDAQAMGPQERLFLQCAYEAIEDAGYTRENVSSRRVGGKDRNVGVFAGVMYDEYQLFNVQAPSAGAGGPSSNPASVANRVSYFCDFRGPSMAVNTMCSSSLTAIHMACESLRAGRCEVAIAGGVNVSIHPSKYITLSQGQFVSEKGRCSSFGDEADGYVPGEGVGAVVLKPLADALADGDHIHAVIKASGINHGGRGNGYTVPLLRAQTELVRDLLAEAGIPPSAVSYVEAHGTGTALGDPIEIEALAEAFGRSGAQGGPCAVGSVKTNIGHLESAAGIAGLTKVVLQLKHRTLAPSLHSRTLNPHIDFAETPFFVPQEAREWTVGDAPGAGMQRIAGVSSFGAGGANAHVVVAEHGLATASRVRRQSDVPVLIVLSARSEAQLAQVADRLAAACAAFDAEDLDRVAYTLQTGREGLTCRAAFVARSLADMRAQLARLSSRETARAGIQEGRVQRRPDSNGIAALLQRAAHPDTRDDALGELAAHWVRGARIDWTMLYPAGHPQRIPLPTYPFERKVHWVQPRTPGAPVAAHLPDVDAPTPKIHPLLHVRGEGADRQRFTSTFDGEEFFLAQHRVAGRKMLPAAAYLEMACAAARMVLPTGAFGDGHALSVRDVSWSRAVVASEGGVAVVSEIDLLDEGGMAFRVSGAGGAGFADSGVYAQAHLQLSAGFRFDDAVVDVAALRAMSDRELSGSDCYAMFRRTGIEYGPRFQGLETLHFGSDEEGRPFSLATFRFPQEEQADAGAFALHPAILDLAFQSFLGIALQRHGADVSGGLPVLEIPFALDALHVAAPLPSHGLIVVRTRPEGKVDITVCDRAGTVAARLEGVSVRRVRGFAKAEEGTAMLLRPTWRPVPAVPAEQWPGTGAKVLVIGGSPAAQRDACARFPDHVVASDVSEAIVQLDGALFDHILWFVPADPRSDAGSPRDAVLGQEEGTIAGFRLVKALLEQGYGTRPLGWTIVTSGTQPVIPGEALDATHAGVHGLYGAVAKEYGDWRVRLIDRALAAAGDPLAEVAWSQQPLPEGATLAVRERLAYRQHLVPRPPVQPAPVYRRHGVYVIVGGAGGVGEALTLHLAEAFQAQVIWLGRRALDPAIEAKLDGVARFGPRPVYLQADAADLASLAQAVQWIKARYPRIDGVVSAALALADRAIFNMQEASFREVLRSKVDVSCNIAHLFSGEPLDFLLFFSSMQSFGRPPGQSNYCAGSVFVDAFCAQISVRIPTARVMNWGYWGTIGAVASPEVQAKMADIGIGSIEPSRGIAALDELLAGDACQLAFVVRLGAGPLDAFLDQQGEVRAPARTASAPALLRTLRERYMKVAAE